MEGGNCSTCSSNTCNTNQWARDDIVKLMMHLLRWLCNRGQCNNNSEVVGRALEGLEGSVLEESTITESDLQKLILLLFYLLRMRNQRCSCCGQTCPARTCSCCGQTCPASTSSELRSEEAIGRSLVEEAGLQSCELQKLKQLLLLMARMLFPTLNTNWAP